VRRHRLVVVFWIIALVVMIPAVLNEGGALSLSQGSTSGSNLESVLASNVIQAQFSSSVANNSLVIVVTGQNVTTPAVQDTIRSLVGQIQADKGLRGVQNVTSVYSILYPVLNSTGAGAQKVLTEANSTAHLLYGVPALYLHAWSSAYNQTGDVTSASAAAFSQASSTLSEENATEYQEYSSHLLSSFNASWTASWSDPSTQGYTALERASLAANESAVPFLSAYMPKSVSFGGALVRSYSLQTYLGGAAGSNLQLAKFAAGYVANSSALSPAFVSATLGLGPKPTQSQLETLAAGVASDPGRYSVGPQIGSLVSSFVSPNANTTLISVSENGSSADNVLAIRSIIAGMGLSNGLAGAPSSASDVWAVQVTGGDAISHDFGGSTTGDLGIILPVTIALLIVATGLFFRSVVTPFVALSSIGVALGISQVFVVIAGTFIAKVDFTIPTILLTIVIGVGTDYSVFIISRYREERVKGLSASEAIVTSVTWAGESITTSGATVIISFLSLTFTSVTFLKTMGVVVGLGVLVALLVALTLVPAVIAMISKSIFWPTAGRRFETHSKGVLTKLRTRSGYFSKSGTFSVKHAKGLIVVALLVSAPALYVYLGTTPTYDFLSGAPSNLESVSASNHLTSAFGGGRLNPSYVVVSFTRPLWNGTAFDPYEMGVLQNMSSYLGSNPDVANVTGPTMPYGRPVDYASAAVGQGSDPQAAQTRAAMLRTIGNEKTTALVTLSFRIDPSSTKALDEAQAMRNYLHANFDSKPGVVQVLLGGASGSIVDTRQVSTSQFNLVVPLVAVGVALVLFIVLDSLVLPLFALVSVLMSIIWTLALTELVFKRLYNYDLLFITPLFLFVTLLGLGMDYNIFILTRVREESRKDSDRNEAVIRAIENTGGVISAAAVILAGSLGALMLSGDLLLKQIGFAFSFSILVDALFVRTYLVPAVMSFLGRWNWYNPVSVMKRSRELFREPRD
jgi:putative drug exporter of the RND superfamily